MLKHSLYIANYHHLTVGRTQKLPLCCISFCYIVEIAVIYVRTKTNLHTAVVLNFKEEFSVSP